MNILAVAIIFAFTVVGLSLVIGITWGLVDHILYKIKKKKEVKRKNDEKEKRN